MPEFDAVDLFAGPGGWDEGARQIGLSTIGLEWDHDACRTALAAGHPRLRCDVATYPTAPFVGKVAGLIASPPCQDFSSAGTKSGEGGGTGQLVREPLRWVRDLRPEWVVLEEVPEVKPIWRSLALDLGRLGYRTWVGILNAAAYGVPQTRSRAILMASLSSQPTPPPPTHSEHGPGLFGDMDEWVSMAAALGLRGSWRLDRRQRGAPVVDVSARPAPTVTGAMFGKGVAVLWDEETGQIRKLSAAEAGIIQSFPADYPWRGTPKEQHQQVGNAVPPSLASHVLAALTGRVLD